ncbi:unnamed protein product [Porites evermanni]|uniref:Ig-like domain-containing protein n=1 Tax=Porites evermanni TaxID=104178 RepID=A0ABN8SS51_9CNID|nr:unnamed protein product [Porites evermanni]
MAKCFSSVLWLKVIFLVANFVMRKEALELDLNLTRQEIITFLDQPANLGCYSTQTGNTSPLSFTWTKDNQIITESSRLRAFGEVIVVTPKSDSDFGTYMCNITNGMSSILCRIKLSKGLNESVSEKEDGGASSESTTGCVNISVLMPVLAVAVLALLLFIHLVIQGKRKRDRELKMTKKKNGNISPHSDGSNVVIGETIEMHANGHVIGLSGDGLQAPGTPISNHVSRSNTYESITGSPSIGRVSRGHAPGSPVGHVPRSPALRHAS